jgi:hypothetical protein
MRVLPACAGYLYLNLVAIDIMAVLLTLDAPTGLVIKCATLLIIQFLGGGEL